MPNSFLKNFGQPDPNLLDLIEQSGGKPVAIGTDGRGTDGRDYTGVLPPLGTSRPSGRTSDELASTSSDSYNGRIFDRWGDNNDSSIQKLLESLVGGQISMENLTDQQYAQLQSLIDYKKYLEERGYNRDLQLEQRDYDFSRLLEQREYDSPEQMLSRLMAIGLSRSAALSLLSSAGVSGSGSGGSASVPYASGVPQNQLGLSPSESSLNNTNRDLAVLGAVFSSLSGVAGLVTAGFSVKNMVVQNALAKNALVASSLQKQAAKDVGDFVSALYSVNPDTGKRYSELPEKSLMSAESVLRYAQNVSRDENPVLYDYMRSSSARSFSSNPYAWQLFDSSYLQHTDARRRALEDDAILQSELLQTQKRLADVNLDQAAESLNKFMEEHEDYRVLRPYINQKNLLSINDDIQMLAASQTPEQLSYRISSLKNHNATLAFIAMVDKMQAENMFDLYQSSPWVQSCVSMSAVMDKLGLHGLAGEITRVVTYAGSGLYESFQPSDASQAESSQPSGSESNFGNTNSAAYRLGRECNSAIKELKDAIKLMFSGDADFWNNFFASPEGVPSNLFK